MHRLEIPIFERLLISSWAMLQLTLGVIGWVIISNSFTPVAPQSAQRSPAASPRSQLAQGIERSSLKQAIAQSVGTLPNFDR